MITLHVRRGRTVLVLQEKPETLVQQLIAEIAELLVETKQATSEETGGLRLAKEIPDGWEELTTHKTQTLGGLGVSDTTIVGLALGNEDFAYEQIPTFEEEDE